MTLRIGAALPDERRSGSGLRVLVESFVAETLVASEVDGRQSARLVTSWWWDEPRTLLRLKLRPNVFFHDGSRLTADVAAEALRTTIARWHAVGFSSIRSVDAVDTETLQIHLSEPDSFLLPDLSSYPILKPGVQNIGTGPFRVVENGDKVRLRAFGQYYRGRPALDSIEINRYQTQRTAWAAMMRGDIDVLHEVSRDAVEFVEAESTVHTYSFPYSYYIPLVFNVRHPVLRNSTVRRALNEAVDRTALIRDGLRGRGRPAYDPVWPEHWAYSALPHRPDFNPGMARLRLESAGFKIRPAGPGAMPSRLSFTCLVWADDSRFERLALVLQQQLAEIGVDMRLQPVRQEELARRTSTGDFDAFLVQMAGRSLSWLYNWHSPSDTRLVTTGYEAADHVLERIRHATSDEDVRAGVADLTRVFDDDPPAIFIAWQVQSRAVSDRFDVQAEPNRDIFANVWQWRPTPPGQSAAAR